MLEALSSNSHNERSRACSIKLCGQIENLLRGKNMRKVRRLTGAAEDFLNPNRAWLGQGAIAAGRIDEDDSSIVAHSIGQFRCQLMETMDIDGSVREFRREGIGGAPGDTVIRAHRISVGDDENVGRVHKNQSMITMSF